jgi:type IV pilus assembly protein PilO
MDRADRQKIILMSLLTIMAAYFGYNGVGAFSGVGGLRAEAEKLRMERNDLAQQVQSAQTMVANLGRIKKERETLEVQLREVSRRLPSEPESAEVLRNVELLAGKSGLIIGTVRRRPNRRQELYIEIPLDIIVGGGYYDLVKFADELAKLPRLVTINELKVDNRGTAPAGPAADLTPGRIGAQVQAIVFQALGGPAATPAGAAAPSAKKP